MAKQLNVNLAFKADTSQAKSAIQELQQTLSKIAYDGSKGISPDMEKAAQAAKELQIHLNNAFNAKTGKFDLSMLDKSLNASKTKVTDLATSLLSAGSSGQQAFLQLAQAISAADQPMLRINSKLKEFGTTMANTVRWQLSSSLLHGFMGGLQSAYGYAQDLNKSLTDIRIVTGASSDEMALFAERANKAAKTLSTTTTDYAKASLIYFQQGLSDAEVEERTNVTIKMANAAGVSAQVVSDQMTAVWNNFDDGSKSLEYYADVMTALGAATASSTDEIADGLQKFAAVADTVGLSYEYATAALATVTAETRESADVVGTAFKTLFARIQGLSLGETLEDGVDLNKYSKALSAIGVSVLDANGNIREMDSILDDLGAKWSTLTEAEKQATAQTVAGVRQYTQLMALMENWDVFQNNLGIAKGAEGALTEQAKIYEESWEAASKRVKASAEGIYQSLLDDKFFISLNNGFSNLLTGIDAFIDGFGGVKTLLISIGSIIMSSFANKIPQVLSDLSYNIKLVTKGTGEAYKNIQAQMSEATQKAFTDFNIDPNSSLGTAIQSANELTAARSKLALVSDKMSTSERQMAEMTLSHIQTQQQELIVLKQKNEALQESISLTAESMMSGSGTAWEDSMDQTSKVRANNFAEKATNGLGENVFDTEILQAELKDLDDFATTITRNINDKIVTALASPETRAAGAQLTDTFKEMQTILTSGIKWDSFKDGETDINNVKAQIKSFIELIPEGARAVLGLDEQLESLDNAEDFESLKKIILSIADGLENASIPSEKLVTSLRGIGKGNNIAQLSKDVNQYNKNAKDAEKQTASLKNILNSFNPVHVVRTSEALGALGGLAGNVYSAMRSIQSLFDAWTNPDLSAWEKFGTTLMSLSMIIPTVMSGFKNYGTIISWITGLNIAEINTIKAKNIAKNEEILTTKLQTMASMDALGAEKAEHAAKIASIVATGMENKATEENIKSKIVEYLTSNKVVGAKAAEAIASAAVKAGIDLETASTWQLIGALLIANVTLIGITAPLWVFIVAAAALAAAVWGICAAFQYLQTQTPEGKLEAAKQKAEELNTVLDSAKQAVEDLKSSFDGYDSAVEALENCTEGTQEWRDALREVNNEVLDLIKQYPELASMTNGVGEKAITRDPKTGQLIVADWAKDELMNNANQAVMNTQTASVMANQDVRKAQINVDKSDLTNEFTSRTIGLTAIDQVGTDVSQTIRNYIISNMSQLGEMTPDEQKQFLQDFVSEKNITTDIDAWADVISDLGPQFGELAGAIDANTAAIQVENEAIAANVLADEQAVQDSEYTNEITQMAANDLNKATDAEIQKLENEGWGTDGIAQWDKVNDEARKVFAEYAKAAGITNYDLLDTTGNDNNRQFVYDNGEREVTVSLEAMRAVVAASRANEELAKNANQLVTVLSNKTDEQVAAITAAVTGDVNNLTVAQAQGEYDIEALANQLSEEDLKAMGYEGDLETMRQAYINAYNEIASSAGDALTDIINDYSQTIQNSLNSLDLSELTLGQVDSLGIALSKALANGGQIGLENIKNMYTQAANSGYGDEFVNALEGVDWTTITPTDLGEHLRAAGVEMEFTDEALSQLINSMLDGTSQLEKVKNSYQLLTDITKDLSTGDVISAEDYALLGDEYQKYFSLQADGTAILTTKASELRDIIHGIEMDKIEGIIRGTKENEQLFQQQEGYMHLEDAQGLLYSYQNSGNHSAYAERLQSYMEAVNNFYGQEFTNYADAVAYMEQENVLLEESQNYMALNAQSREELNRLLAEGLITTEQFNNATETVFANEVKAEGFDLETINNYAESLQDIYGLQEDISKESALYLSKMNKGIETLNKNWSSWSKNLVSSKKGTAEYAEAFSGVKEAVSDLLDIDISKLDNSFFESAENLELIGKAANGDAEAIDTLRAKAAAEIFLGVGYDLDGLSESEQAILDSMMNLANEDILIGAKLNDTEFGQSLIDAAVAAEGTVESIQSMFESLGWEPEIKTEKIPIEQAFQQMQGQGYVDIVDPATGEVTRVTTEAEMKSYSSDGMIEVFSINGDATVYKGGGSNTSKPSSSGGGGGGGSKKPAEKKTKSDVVDRYKEVNDQLEETASLMNKNSKIADSLWGSDRFDAMKKGIELMKKENELLKDKLSLAKDYLAEDTDTLFQAAADAGVSFEIDADTGFITNYTEEMNALVERYNQMVESANSDGEVTEEEQDELDDMDKRVDALKDAVSQYDETIGEMRDLEENILENDLAIMSENFSILQEQLELEITINDSEMKNVDYFLSLIEDDLYSIAEAYALMSQQAKIYEDNLQNQEEFLAEVTRQYEAGEISQADYKQSILDVQDATIENLENLEATKEAMQDFYGNALNTAVEKVYEYTDSMEQLNSVLDHYSSILSLVGKQEDYATKNKILDGKATNLKNQIDVQSEMYKNASADADKWYKKMSEAVEGSNEYETYRKNWLAAKEIADTAQEEMLAKTEEWAQAMKEIIQNELAEAAKSMEESLTGGESFDELLTSMEHSKSLQEEYLTTTNKIYETNKLMNKAQQDIDKSTNTIAKNKLKNFIKETDNLQKKNKLSQFELEIQQAKYELLLAEIALQESQNAKSNVTLQRDSEGNYGYVYTANQEDIAAAQQQVEDAQNALYNIGLEGANNYAEKYIQLMAQCQDEITELTEMWMNGEIATEEEYNRRRAEIESYYYEQLKTYSNLYQVALGVDTNIIKDTWTSSYGEMTTKTDEWKTAVSNYFDTSAESFKAWEGVCSTALELSGLEDIGTAVDNIKGKSEDLTTALIGEDGVVDGLWAEAEAAGEVSEAYLAIQNNIDAVILKYREYLDLLEESYQTPTSPTVDDDPSDNERNPDSDGNGYTGTPYTPSSGGGGGSGGYGNPGTVPISRTVTTYNTPQGGNPKQVTFSTGNYKLNSSTSTSFPYPYHYYKISNPKEGGWVATKMSFDTGGYTGSWGPEGKMAMLHEKELVLNAKDTENFLASMDLLDKIIAAIDLYSLNQQFTDRLNSPSLGYMGNNDILEQQVHIEASFPNVTNHSEIEEAFNNLINTSSQYANRK